LRAGSIRGIGGVLMLLTVALVSLLAVAVAAPAAVTLQPHRAIYRMALSPSNGPSEVTAADGSMFYRFAQVCDGWTVENRTVLRLNYRDGGDSETVWTFAGWESADGLRFRFRARYEQDGTPVEVLEGHASLEKAGGAGTAQFLEPEEKVIALPRGTLFPSEHVKVLIEAARRGEKSLTRVVFDGASMDNPYLVHAVIGTLKAAEREALAKRTRLPGMEAWWTRMAFFPYFKDQAQAEFEIGAHYRADGIADRIVQQFETFAVSVTLGEFEVLKRPDC
jgi:hypothetical protein